MRRKTLAALLVPVAFVAAGSGIVLAHSLVDEDRAKVSPAPGSAHGSVGVEGSKVPGRVVTVTGSVNGRLGPGNPATLDVAVTNSGGRPILVTKVTGAVTSVTALRATNGPACSKAWYVLGDFLGSQRIAKHASGRVALPLTFIDESAVNQDSCKGATYHVTFTASAREAAL